MVMKVVNKNNLSVEQLIIALAKYEKDLYDNWKELEETLGDDYIETLEKQDEWRIIYDFMNEMIIGVEEINNINPGTIEI